MILSHIFGWFLLQYWYVINDDLRCRVKNLWSIVLHNQNCSNTSLFLCPSSIFPLHSLSQDHFIYFHGYKHRLLEDTLHVCIVTLNLVSELKSSSQLSPCRLMSQKHLKFQTPRGKLLISLNNRYLYSLSLLSSSFLCGEAGSEPCISRFPHFQYPIYQKVLMVLLLKYTRNAPLGPHLLPRPLPWSSP